MIDRFAARMGATNAVEKVGGLADRFANKVLPRSVAHATYSLMGCQLGSCGCWSNELNSMVRVLECSWGNSCTDIRC